jgi:hypothetical protein
MNGYDLVVFAINIFPYHVNGIARPVEAALHIFLQMLRHLNR